MKRFSTLVISVVMLTLWVSQMTVYAQTPSSVTNLQASDGTFSEHISLFWGSQYNGSNVTFTIYRTEDPNDQPIELATVDGNQRLFLDRAVLLGVTYTYWVQVTYNGFSSTLGESDSGYLGTSPTPVPSPSPTITPPQLCPNNGTTVEERVQQGVDLSTPDPVWLSFQVVTDTSYLIELYVPITATADITLSVFNDCNGDPMTVQNYNHTYHAREMHYAPTSGMRYIKIENGTMSENGFAWLSVRPLRSVEELSSTRTAIIVVADTESGLSEQLHGTADRLYRYFLRTHSHLHYIASDSERNPIGGLDSPSDVNDEPSLENLEWAISDWTANHLEGEARLTIVLIGDDGESFSLNDSGEILTVELLDQWFSDLESRHPNIMINLVVESSQAGAFLSLSAPNRTLILATDNTAAHASPNGTHFIDHWFTGIDQAMNWSSAYRFAQSSTTTVYPNQQPLLDANGNGVANEAADYTNLSNQEFNFTGIFGFDGLKWQPTIIDIDIDIENEITVHFMDDNDPLTNVWVIPHPITPNPPSHASHHILTSPITLTKTGTNTWSTPNTFTESVRFTAHAQNSLYLLALPQTFTVTSSSNPVPLSVTTQTLFTSQSDLAYQPMFLIVVFLLVSTVVAYTCDYTSGKSTIRYE